MFYSGLLNKISYSVLDIHIYTHILYCITPLLNVDLCIDDHNTVPSHVPGDTNTRWTPKHLIHTNLKSRNHKKYEFIIQKYSLSLSNTERFFIQKQLLQILF